MAIGVALSLPFLGVSSLNFGPLARAAFFSARALGVLFGGDAVRRNVSTEIVHHLAEHFLEVGREGRKGWLSFERPLVHVDRAVDLDLQRVATEGGSP